ncbi:MAG: C40 family peptidase [Lachnospiraceae bacterium]|nr:C40 family peptidase [Lachnospiraceae bacterium]
MAVMLGSTSLTAGAARFDMLDASTAVAGASAVLSDYFASNEDAAEKIAAALSPIIAVAEETASVGGYNRSQETTDETLYEASVKGVASVDGVLNIREAPSTLSNIVECVMRGGEVTVLGERTVNGNLWYKVEFRGIEGYVAGNYVAFGTEAEELKVVVQKEQTGETSLPGKFVIPDDISWLGQSLQDKLNYFSNEINYCIGTNYPEEAAKENYIGMYAILLYLLENYQGIMDIANEYGLTATYNTAAAAIRKVDASRESISAYTGSSEEQMVASIIEAATPSTTTPPETTAPPVVAAAPAPAETAAPAPAPAPAETPAPAPAETPAPEPQPAQPAPVVETPAPVVFTGTGGEIAAYAASWVGRINYVYGGNDFREGGGVDCSHFTYNVYKHFGLISSYDTSGGQRNWGYAVALSDIQPGDLVCYPGHVAIYYGNGQIVHAPAPGRMIEIGSLYVLDIVGVRRLY